MLYTGGTTGMPKGVLWRQHDIYMAPSAGEPRHGVAPSYVEVAGRAAAGTGSRLMVLSPLMHGAAQWGV